MTYGGLGEMVDGDSADTCAGKLPLMSMGGRAEGLACADPGGRTPIGVSGNCIHEYNLLWRTFKFAIVATIFIKRATEH